MILTYSFPAGYLIMANTSELKETISGLDNTDLYEEEKDDNRKCEVSKQLFIEDDRTYAAIEWHIVRILPMEPLTFIEAVNLEVYSIR